MDTLQIALLGNVALDVTTYLGDQVPDPRLESCNAEQITACAGSCAVNHCKALLALGTEPRVFSMYAPDFLGELLLGDLRNRGIGTEDILPMLRENNRTVLLVKGDGNKFIFSKRGEILAPEVVARTFLPRLARYPYVHVALNDWNREILLELHRRCPGISLSTDLHLNGKTTDGELLGAIKIVFCSGAGDPAPQDTVERLLSFGPEIAICTLGPEGCLVGQKGCGVREYPAVHYGASVDTVGAGDVFAATFLSAYYRGMPVEDAVAMASIQAGYRVTQMGLERLLDGKALGDALAARK